MARSFATLEWTEWNRNPVQVQICDACGTYGCASGGYVHVSAVQDTVLWTVPQNPQTTDVDFFPATAVERFGSAAFPRDAWMQLQRVAPELPQAADLQPATGRALRNAWVCGQNRPLKDAELIAWLGARLLAADSLDSAAALQWVEYWLSWFAERAASAITGILAGATEAETRKQKRHWKSFTSMARAAMTGRRWRAIGGHLYLPLAAITCSFRRPVDDRRWLRATTYDCALAYAARLPRSSSNQPKQTLLKRGRCCCTCRRTKGAATQVETTRAT